MVLFITMTKTGIEGSLNWTEVKKLEFLLLDMKLPYIGKLYRCGLHLTNQGDFALENFPLGVF